MQNAAHAECSVHYVPYTQCSTCFAPLPPSACPGHGKATHWRAPLPVAPHTAKRAALPWPGPQGFKTLPLPLRMMAASSGSMSRGWRCILRALSQIMNAVTTSSTVACGRRPPPVRGCTHAATDSGDP